MIPTAAVTVFVAVTIFGVAIRMAPFLVNPRLGIDNWYWLLCARDVRSRRRLPPDLPCFMLETSEQWYPPLFSGVLALLPQNLLENHGGKLAQLVDLVHAILIYWCVYLAGDNVTVAATAALSYAIAFFPVQYNCQLQPRGLANLLLTVFMIGLWGYLDNQQVWMWCVLAAAGAVILLLHKMTSQIWVVFVIAFGLWSGKVAITALVPASVLVAVIISGGFYVKVLRSQWDIITFWHRNIRFLNSHQYYESSRYRKPGFTSTALHRPGVSGHVKKAAMIVAYNVFILIVPVLLLAGGGRVGHGPDAFLWIWLGVTYVWVFATTFVPFFTALGAGVYYVYQSFLPLFLLGCRYVDGASQSEAYILYSAWGVAILVSLCGYGRFLHNIRKTGSHALTDDLRQVLDTLKTEPHDGVFCIPFKLPDLTAYWTGKKVFWGGHSMGFHRLLQPYFPLMQADVKQVLQENSLHYVLYWHGYLDALIDIGLDTSTDIRSIIRCGEFELFEVTKD